MSHLNVVITGVTSGLGRELSETMLTAGATVYGIARNGEKMRGFQEEMKAKGDVVRGTFVPIQCDLGSLEEVRGAARAVTDKVKKSKGNKSVDYLINNAGIHYGGDARRMGVAGKTDGMDDLFVTNYLSHFLLTKELLPLVEKSPKATVVQVSSSYHWQSDGSMLRVGAAGGGGDNLLPMAARGDVHDARWLQISYANSKLAQILHARALARRLKSQGKKTKLVSICPSWVGTSIAPEGIFRNILKVTGFTPAQGIYPILMAMFRPEVKSGDMVTNTRFPPRFGPYFSKNVELFGVHIRDITVNLMAGLLLVVQELDFGWYIGDSSLESYNVELQDNLYNWSEGAVEKYSTS